ncbi:hypothetical protein HZD82_27300, partial [Pantoea agglomerans]|nr:hypothetical protein [Pantoea agglomerans]
MRAARQPGPLRHQHAKAEAIGQADMFGVLAEEPEQVEKSYASVTPWPEQVQL